MASSALAGEVSRAVDFNGLPVATVKRTSPPVVFNGYYWLNKAEMTLCPAGLGSGGRWAHLTGYHYFNVCPAAWRIATPLADYDDPQGLFPKEHIRMLKALYGKQLLESRPGRIRVPMGLQCDGHGIFAHEMGQSFGLGHPEPGEPTVKGNIMGGAKGFSGGGQPHATAPPCASCRRCWGARGLRHTSAPCPASRRRRSRGRAKGPSER